MILAIYLEDMSTKFQGEFYASLEIFALSNFDIKVSDDGTLTVDGEENPFSYCMSAYTKSEVISDYAKSTMFKGLARSKFWTLYNIKDKII